MADPNEDFVSFEKALRDLKMQSEELKRLVSEGEIRAFRDGQSMKFKREDIESLADDDDNEELVFAESLEDDTGMVTEELSDEETLLAEDDLVDDEPAPTRRSRTATPAPARRARAVEAEEEQATEPMWATVAAGLCAVVAIYGFMVIYSIATETPPDGLTALFKG